MLVLGAMLIGPAGPASARPVAAKSSAQLNVLTTDNFRVLYTGDEQWAQDTATLIEGLRGEFYQGFADAGFSVRPSGQPLVWMCFENHSDFVAYGRRADRTDASQIHGYYSLHTNIVAIARVGHRTVAAAPVRADLPASFVVPENIRGSAEASRTLHEAAHQLAFNSGLQKRGVAYPLWLTEGLAMQFEPDEAGGVGLGRDNPARRAGLVEMRSRGRLLPLGRLITMTQFDSASGRTDRELYAQSWGLFHFLMQARPEQMKKYMAILASMPTGRSSTRALSDAFVNSFGPPAALEAEWGRFLAALAGGSPAARPASTARR